MVFHKGLLLGPILFLIYVNDMCNVNFNCSLVQYADDCQFILKGKVENLNETRVSPHFKLAPATEHISNLHYFRSNKVYYQFHAIIDLLCECGVIWIKSDGFFLITNKQTRTHTHTYIQH